MRESIVAASAAHGSGGSSGSASPSGAGAAAAAAGGSSWQDPALASLYKDPGDLSLKDGQTIRSVGCTPGAHKRVKRSLLGKDELCCPHARQRNKSCTSSDKINTSKLCATHYLLARQLAVCGVEIRHTTMKVSVAHVFWQDQSQAAPQWRWRLPCAQPTSRWLRAQEPQRQWGRQHTTGRCSSSLLTQLCGAEKTASVHLALPQLSVPPVQFGCATGHLRPTRPSVGLCTCFHYRV
jgi:hypothetical protein